MFGLSSSPPVPPGLHEDVYPGHHHRRDGLYYFFEHSDSAHKLIITNGASFHEPSRDDAIRYQPVVGGDLGADLFEVFATANQLAKVDGEQIHIG